MHESIRDDVPRVEFFGTQRQPNEPSRFNSRFAYKIGRDVLIFQVMLWLEGFKDFVLMPLSPGAAVIDLVFRGGKGRGTLDSVMKLGDRFERWVDLYAALEERESNDPDPSFPANSLDDLLNDAAGGIEKKATNGDSSTTDRSRSVT